jgi:thimet oligopeptidase
MFEKNKKWIVTTLVTFNSLLILGAPGHAAADPLISAPLIRSDFQKGELTGLCQKAMESVRGKIDAIASIAPQAQNFDNTVLALESTLADFTDATTPLTFMGYVSKSAVIRGEGADCEQAVGKFSVEMNTRKDVYLTLKDQVPRNENEKRLLSETIKGFEANGLSLGDAQLARFKDLKQKLATVESQFSTNLNNDDTHVELSSTELTGLPADYIADLKRSSDGTRFLVSTRESDAEPMLSLASNSEARRKWQLAYFNRQGVQNTQLLETAIGLRQQIAQVMGYATWADYRIHGRMATDAKTVLSFLNSLKAKLAQRNHEDMGYLLKYKKALDPSATEVNNWDINYLSYQLKKRDYLLDEEKIREYFPAEVVIAGLFDIYSNLLGVTFKEVANAPVWSSDVKLYQIENAQDHRFIGYFYTDFFPRASKYDHAAAFPLITGRILSSGEYSHPVSAIVANLSAPSNGKPSLLSHNDVVTMFHEFGHIMHQTLTRAPYASLSGSSVAQDFVEAPSQMLENWPWDVQVLNKISGHYLDHTQKLPADLLQKMISARDFNQGYYYTRQLTLALLDMTYHTATGPVETAAVYDQIFKDTIGITSIPGGHFAASFGHLMGGYDAGYYSYLWSEVYAADMFTRFSSEGVLNAKVGAEYRQVVLEKGNMQDALELLREFLGREPNSDAFFKKLHL